MLERCKKPQVLHHAVQHDWKIVFLALKCFEKAVLDFFSLLGAEVLFCMFSSDWDLACRAPAVQLMMADMLDCFSREPGCFLESPGSLLLNLNPHQLR